MKTYRWLVLVAAMPVAVLGSNTVAAASPSPCDTRLTVELTPDVPNRQDVGFLSSLLSGYSGYQLILTQQLNGSVIVVELTGPGPDYDCQNVIEAIRKDGRVLSVREEVS